MALIITIHTHFSANKKFICNKIVEKTYKYFISLYRTTLVRLASHACNTRGNYRQYSRTLLAILVGFVCKTRQHCL